MEEAPNLYATLHIVPEATAADVGRAYRALLRRYHPDTLPSRTAVPIDALADRRKLQQIMDAYAILSDPAQRACYDQQQQRSSPEPARVNTVREPRFTSTHAQPPLRVGPLQWEPPPRRCS
ncbi:J domain-containing protein [Arthrobacter sp. LAPM80]|uniref:J domain-containing protein n=1 Tax=Arthrobacter sp. LAPM80 TaxID=3141788 RepID=UPI00398A8AB9